MINQNIPNKFLVAMGNATDWTELATPLVAIRFQTPENLPPAETDESEQPHLEASIS